MNNIILSNGKLKAYEGFMALGEYASREPEWLNALWEKIVLNDALLEEFIFYLEHHTFYDKMDCMGYTMSDIYVFQMNRYNLVRDSGKNTSACNKECMVLNAFYDMSCMLENPDKYIRRLTGGSGMDRI